MSNTTLNGDILSYILSFVSSPRDLLAASLANRELLALAEPELTYRFIRCRLGNTAVWEHLIENPALASRVRSLEIQRENSSGYGPLDERERVPLGRIGLESVSVPSMNEEDEEDNIDTRRYAGRSVCLGEVEESEGLLAEALRSMVNVERFTWDRWVPVINQGGEISVWPEQEHEHVPTSFQGDIWTALRDYTQLRKLKVVDLGAHDAIVPNPYSIYDSTLFTIGNLTHIDLKIYYSPENSDEGAGGNNDGHDDWDELIPGRVNIERLREFLLRSPNLEHLTLAIIDRNFYHYGGNPFTNITPIISSAYWPHLSSLKLSDLTVNDEVMVDFLNRHPSLREISSFFSLSEGDLPKIPFSLDTCEQRNGSSFLPDLEIVDAAPGLTRSLLRALSHPASVRSVGIVEPCDWGAAEDDDDDDGRYGRGEYMCSLDEVWGAPAGGVYAHEPGDGPPNANTNLLEGMTGLCSLKVQDMRSLAQLEKLVEAAPGLEVLQVVGWGLDGVRLDSRAAMLACIAKWPRLTTLTGVSLWPNGGHRSTEVAEDVREIVAACPNLREVSWIDGSTAVLVKDASGSVRLELSSGPV